MQAAEVGLGKHKKNLTLFFLARHIAFLADAC